MGIPEGDALAAGNKADLIFVNLRKARLVPVLRVACDSLHQGQGRDVEAVMVDGQWVMRGGDVPTVDAERFVADARRIAKVAWRRPSDANPGFEVRTGFAPRK
jgi:5-methylthioadenosine/S-adenosylhomocysteine deaminase